MVKINFFETNRIKNSQVAELVDAVRLNGDRNDTYPNSMIMRDLCPVNTGSNPVLTTKNKIYEKQSLD